MLLRENFEKNDKLISELKIHEEVNEADILEEHRNSVLDYNWVVNETSVWRE
jgi:hypothetical protein